MDSASVSYYDSNAPELCHKYEAADMSMLKRRLERHLPEAGAVLEIGCGSGRDAAVLKALGYDVTAVDASAGMCATAVACHPELSDRILCEAMPFADGSPLLSRTFDAVVCVATLMHVPDQELFEVAYQIRQILRPDGIVFLTVSSGRAGISGNRDPDGRLFVERSPDQLRLLFERLGFNFVAQYVDKDSLARSHTWHSLVLQAGRPSTRSIDQIESIVSRDRKDATYKLALLRALCDIARSESRKVTWYPGAGVGVPLGLVAEKWLFYYWPIVEPDLRAGRVVIPQKRGRELRMPLAFRRDLLALIAEYKSLNGLNRFYVDYRSNRLDGRAKKLADQALNKIAATIVSGPVTFAGGSLDASERFFRMRGKKTARGRCTNPESLCRSLGEIVFPAAVWREMCLIGHWISESIILRWAELTAEISDGNVEVSEVVARLLVRPSSQRDVELARSVYTGLPDLQCVWTLEPLGPAAFAVDHVIPFSLWLNNDLWNLLPAAPRINTAKSDKLVCRETMLSRRGLIVHYWESLRAGNQSRFDNDLQRSLLWSRCSSENWQTAAFAGLVENVETLAAQRGTARWAP